MTARLEETLTPTSVGLPILVATPTSARITPVYTPPILHSISRQACLITDLPAGGETPWESPLFAWSPNAKSLVYLQPEDTYTHTLMLTAAPQFDTPRRLTSNVIGDLFWSPDGSRIAFVSLRSDKLETVMTVASDGSGLHDWFPGELAQTDPGKGSKAIIGWADQSNLWVMTNCGAGCRRLWQLHLEDGALRETNFHNESNHLIWGSDYIWSPDYGHLVFISGGDIRVGLTSVARQEVKWLSGGYRGQVQTAFADWSPDGSALLYLKQNVDEDHVPSGPPELSVWDVIIDRGTQLLPGTIAASWSPAEDLIAFLSLGNIRYTADGKWQGTTATLEGPNLLGVGLYQRREGKVIAFAPIGATDTGYRWLGQLQQQLLRPTWSPDGEHLAYRDSAGKAWVLSATDLSQYDLDTGGDPVTRIRWSPDGRILAVSTLGHLWIIATPCSP